MRTLRGQVYLENAYPAVHLGLVVGDGKALLIDAPLRVEDGREWLGQVATLARPAYLALLDHHPDRVLGARSLNLRRIAHEATRKEISRWPDTYKGSTRPLGAEADRLKRITGVSQAVPEVAFTEEMTLLLGDREVRFLHRPGPTPGAMWVVVPDAQVVFIGDAITVSEPPYLGDADIEAWLATLDDLRGPEWESYHWVASRDGLVDREAANDMARFLRKVPFRLERMGDRQDPAAAAETIARELVEDFKVPAGRRDQALLRLRVGLERLFRHHYPAEG